MIAFVISLAISTICSLPIYYLLKGEPLFKMSYDKYYSKVKMEGGKDGR